MSSSVFRRMMVAILLLTALLTLEGLAFADTIYLTDGRMLEGKIISQNEDKVVIRTGYGSETLDRMDIEKIVDSEMEREEYERKRAKIKAEDARGHYRLGLWCKRKCLEKEARAQFEHTIRIDPDHERARKELGYKRYKGKWLTPGQIKEKKRREKENEAARLAEEAGKAAGPAKEGGEGTQASVSIARVREAIAERKFLKAAGMLNEILDADSKNQTARELFKKILPSVAPPAYRYRWSRDSQAREGMSRTTERAVLRALKWLQRHQDKSGKWDHDGFEGCCAGEACGGRGTGQYDVACTGLAVLAYLGSGYTHRAGMFKSTIKRALDWLAGQQSGGGTLGGRAVGVESWVYSHAMATMALSAARAAGFDVPDKVFKGAINWFDKTTNNAGKCGYIRPGDSGSVLGGGFHDHFERLPTMTAVAIVARILCGQSRRHRIVLKGFDLLTENTPRWSKGDLKKDTAKKRKKKKKEKKDTIDMYYWYHATNAMFLCGGKKWQKWDNAVRKALLDNRHVGGCADGSWDPVSKWGMVGGRVYSTAIACLTLEVYYRYARKK